MYLITALKKYKTIIAYVETRDASNMLVYCQSNIFNKITYDEDFIMLYNNDLDDSANNLLLNRNLNYEIKRLGEYRDKITLNFNKIHVVTLYGEKI